MRRTLFVAAAVPVLVLLGAASASATPQTDPDPGHGPDQLIQCLREHGVEIPDPVPGEGPTTVRVGSGADGGPVVVFSAGTAGREAVAATPGTPPPPGEGRQEVHVEGPDGPDVVDVDPAVAAEFRAALQACEQFAPERDVEVVAADRAELVPFAQCMRENGLPGFPEPSEHGIELSDSDELQVRPGDPAFDAAEEACRTLLPAPRAGGAAVPGAVGAGGVSVAVPVGGVAAGGS
jgi:hypothetical protein